MLNFVVDNLQGKKVLKYIINENDELDTSIEGMLKENMIDGIIPLQYSQMDNLKEYIYHIDGYCTLKDFLKNEVTKSQMIKVLKGMFDVIDESAGYYIAENNFILDLEHVFIDENDSVKLIVLPKDNLSKTNYSGLIKEILMESRYSKNDDASFMPAITNYLNSNESFSIQGFLNLLKELNSNKETKTRETKKVESHKNINYEIPDKKEEVRANREEDQVQPYNGVKLKNSTSIPTRSKKDKVSKEEVVQEEKNEEVKKDSFMSKIDALLHYDISFGSNKSDKKKKEKTEKKKGNKKERKVKESSKIPTKKSRIGVNDREDFSVKEENNIKNDSIIEDAIPNTVYIDDEPESKLNIGKMVSNKKEPEIDEESVLNEESTSVEAGTVLMEETPTVLTDEYKIPAFLLRVSNAEKTEVTKDVFKIGRSSQRDNDLVVKNMHVGNSHAEIIFDGMHYFLKDNNAQNHTYLNGRQLNKGAKVKIKDGDKIGFADEEFKFIYKG